RKRCPYLRNRRMEKTEPMMISKEIKEGLKLPVNTVTIRRTLSKVPLLGKRHVAKEHIDWPKEKWSNILWTDERHFMNYGESGDRTGYLVVMGQPLCP
uniref:Transposase Tc1-like domain-containing protein n=1 Tax=Cyclopterus lumpus TaxID=8103 RepID=A0A8C3GBQ7_CYCLU